MLTAEAGARPDASGVTVRAPLLSSVVQSLDDGRRHLVLDLGPARQAVLDLLSGHRCRVDVVDLPGALKAGGGPRSGADPAAWFKGLFPPALGERASLVLCWNLLDGLTLEDISVLTGILATRGHSRCLLHAVIQRPTKRGAAGRVHAVVPAGADHLMVYHDPPEGLQVAAGHPLSELKRHLSGFRYEHGRLLANGMQELLLRVDHPVS
ncbi:hypothetical protein ACN2MM_13150 [Alkalilimnicola ehrlichii MLHE-1]|uniref:Uncharacterized protein n=1 Tax=Alkalilimnicola ehrlichii (strain ATCC BAA-1101 / DSM 17681 / MLHE-1) TaxID=187272 RepID=Q0A5S0_ALKEH|nr:hypothetical protein [Alkalilimnicola ehrlichii]ABI57817.1 hypothetical protein Mlg_2477 [Alkalilimnicola ehrlichii MLHE-1]